MPTCQICGEFHDTPRQTKNCEKRNRKRIQSPPKAPKPHPVTKFDESDLVVAYRKWLLSLEEN